MHIIIFTVIMIHIIKSIINIYWSLREVTRLLYQAPVVNKGCIHNKYLVIIPVFNEHDIIGELIHMSLPNIMHKNIHIVIATHKSQIDTINLIRSELDSMAAFSNSDVLISLMINDEDEFSKAGQLTYVLKHTELDRYQYISIYDCDSLPDIRAMEYIDALSHSDKTHHVFQQIPFYPDVFGDNILEKIALARNIHSLNYSYSCEMVTFGKSTRQNPLRMSIHLLGHGEHMPYRTIELGGGFNPPFCDSALGFSLSFNEVPIYIIPYPDISTSPTSIRDSYQQGVRWYAGCDLYWREYRSLIGSSHGSMLKMIKLAFTLLNNIRWGTLPLLCVILLFNENTLFFVPTILLLLFIRHMVLLKSYQQLSSASKVNKEKHNELSQRQWASLYLPYLIMRFIWSLVPVEYYLRSLFNRPYQRVPTPKRAHNYNVN